MENEEKQQASHGQESEQGRRAADPKAETTEEILNEWDGLLFGVRRSIRYHSDRAGWFEFWGKFATAFAIFVSAGAITALLKQCELLSIIASALIVLLSTISLVFGWSQREHLHTDLKKKFIDIEKAMVKCQNPNSDILAEMTAERLSIEADEPKTVKALNIMCHNELCFAQGYGTIYKVGWLRSKLCHIDLPFNDPQVERTIG